MNNLSLRDENNQVKVILDTKNLKDKIGKYVQAKKDKELRKQKKLKIKKNEDKKPLAENRFLKGKPKSTFGGLTQFQSQGLSEINSKKVTDSINFSKDESSIQNDEYIKNSGLTKSIKFES